MLSYKDPSVKKFLDDLNPFIEWKLIDHELVITTQKPLAKWEAISIPIGHMKYMESVFFEAPKSYHLKLRAKNKNLPSGVKIRIKYMNNDPVYNKPGIRVWNTLFKHDYHKAKIIDIGQRLQKAV